MAVPDDDELLQLPDHVGEPELPESVDKGRFQGDTKSNHLVQAEKQAVAKDAPKALFEFVCKPLKQEAIIRTTKNVDTLVSIKTYRIV